MVTYRPAPSSEHVSRRFSAQPVAATHPEMELRRALHAAGNRYRVGYPVPGMPRRSIDIAFTRARVAVFLDGCFWHSCPYHGSEPRANAEWWAEKLANNVLRDRQTDVVLREAGWTVLRIWEHDVRGASPANLRDLVHRIVTAVVDANRQVQSSPDGHK